jgi:hypothetical protein
MEGETTNNNPIREEDRRKVTRIVSRFFARAVKPLAYLMMRYGLSAENARGIMQWAFIKAFYENPDLWRHEKPTALHCSLKTGLPRSQISDIEEIDDPDAMVRLEKQNRAARILSAWVTDPDFSEQGMPHPLPLRATNDQPSFSKLVRQYSADARTRNVLAELQEANCIEVRENKVHLISQTYGSSMDELSKVEISGCLLNHHASTVNHNIMVKEPDARHLHRKWRSCQIPVAKMEEAKREIVEIAIKAGREIDKRLAAIAASENDHDSSCVELGVVMFTYDEPESTVQKIPNVQREGDDSWMSSPNLH